MINVRKIGYPMDSNIVTAETLSLVEKTVIDLNLAINLLTTTTAGKGHLNVSYLMKVLNNDVSPTFKIP